MRNRLSAGIAVGILALTSTRAGIKSGHAQSRDQAFSPVIPRMWDDAAMAKLEISLANPIGSPKHVSADYYYRIPLRPIYKTYPLYEPGHEPKGYWDWLQKQEPMLVWGDANGKHAEPQLKTEADWIKAGELVFDAPIAFDTDAALPQFRQPKIYQAEGIPLTAGGVDPFHQYVVREKGKVEFAFGACADCHTRVMPDGSVIKGAQGNMPAERAIDFLIRSAHIPDLIGVKDRHYLDATGLVQQRGIDDFMRYAALNQGGDDLSSYGGFVPAGENFHKLPEPDKLAFTTPDRYSDKQLYALALYLYSLQPPPNPNKFDAVAGHGQKVFEREGCAGCHTPPLYTNNKLTLAEGFTPPPGADKKYDILPISVGTDPNLTMKTRRGTGYYKVPSLKGVWYRSMFGHSGWCATLEDWFDPRRVRDDYVPTGFKPYDAKAYAVKGHPFGLDLSAEDKKALITFLKTL
jgi:hypothetical protein